MMHLSIHGSFEPRGTAFTMIFSRVPDGYTLRHCICSPPPNQPTYLVVIHFVSYRWGGEGVTK